MKHAPSSLLFIMLLCGMTHLLNAQSQKQRKTFATEVKLLLDGDWTEIHISQALATDYVQVYSSTISLKREKQGAPISRFSIEKKAVDQPMTPAAYKQLAETVIIAAGEVENLETPGEIILRVGAEEAAKMIRDRKLPALWDVEMLVIHAVDSSRVESAPEWRV